MNAVLAHEQQLSTPERGVWLTLTRDIKLAM